MKIADFNSISSYYADQNTFGWTNTLARTNAFPVEKFSVFNTYSDAVKYVNGEEIANMGPTDGLAYIGQIVAVVSGTESGVYRIDPNGTDGLTKLATNGALEDLSNYLLSDDGIIDQISNSVNLSASQMSSAIALSVAGISSVVALSVHDISNAVAISAAGISSSTALSVGQMSSAIALSVAGLSSSAQISITAAPGEEGSDILTSYTISQGGIPLTTTIDIPKDKVISSAYVVDVVGTPATTEATRQQVSSFTVSYDGTEISTVTSADTGHKAVVYTAIHQAYCGKGGGDGKYMRLTVENDEAAPIYIALPQLVDTYVGGSTSTISVGINTDTRTIYAKVNAKSIDGSHLTDELSDQIANTVHYRGIGAFNATLKDGATWAETSATLQSITSYKTKTPIAGDLVINTTTESEYIFTCSELSVWKEFGSKTQISALSNAISAVSSDLCVISSELCIAISGLSSELCGISSQLCTTISTLSSHLCTTISGLSSELCVISSQLCTAISTVSSDLCGLSSKYTIFVGQTYPADMLSINNTICAVSSTIEDELAAEVDERSTADEYLSGVLSTVSSHLDTVSSDLDTLEANAILSIKLNELLFSVSRNFATLSIEFISCGNAN